MTIFSFLGWFVPGSVPGNISKAKHDKDKAMADVAAALAPEARRHGAGPQPLRAVSVGPPFSGKSTLLNHLSSMIHGDRSVQTYFSQGQAGASIHVTVQIRDVDVTDAGGRPIISVRDTQGVFQVANLHPTLSLMVSGTLDPLKDVNEQLLPFIDHQQPAPAPGADYASRVNTYLHEGVMNTARVRAAVQGASDARKPLVVLIVINAVALMGRQSDAVLAGIRDFCNSKCQFPGTNTERDIQCHLVITKVDEWSKVKGWFWNAGPSCLLKQQNGCLSPLFARAEELGFDPPHTTAIGWLRKEFEHCNPTDPRVIVLRRIVEVVIEKSNTQLMHLRQNPNV